MPGEPERQRSVHREEDKMTMEAAKKRMTLVPKSSKDIDITTAEPEHIDQDVGR